MNRECGTCKHRTDGDRNDGPCLTCIESMSGWEPDESLPKVRDGMEQMLNDAERNWVAAFRKPVDELVAAVRSRLPVEMRDRLSWWASQHTHGIDVHMGVVGNTMALSIALDANADVAALAEIVVGRILGVAKE